MPPPPTMRFEALVYGNDMNQLFRFVQKDRWMVRCWLGTVYGICPLPANWCVI